LFIATSLFTSWQREREFTDDKNAMKIRDVASTKVTRTSTSTSTQVTSTSTSTSTLKWYSSTTRVQVQVPSSSTTSLMKIIEPYCVTQSFCEAVYLNSEVGVG